MVLWLGVLFPQIWKKILQKATTTLAESWDHSGPTDDLQTMGSTGGVVRRGTYLESPARQSQGE